MKQLISEGKELKISELPVPTISDDQVLVKNYYSIISTGTEISNISFMKDPLYKKVLNYPDKIQKALKMVQTKGLSEVLRIGIDFLNIPREWGYSSCGKVIEVGKNIKDIKVGDMVACAGAGKANHAEYVAVPENLVAKVPCETEFLYASSATIGAIAMQGVRQCNPLLGETIVVVGLGLIGRLTAFILQANGVNVIGIETNPARIQSALDTGFIKVINPTTQNVLNEIKFLNSNLVDGVIITASSKDNKLINQALEITRKKGRVVAVGNIGLNILRSAWYEKEIDLKISYSYGPGRGDYMYEEKGVDYPLEFVRFTEKRNMESFLKLLQNDRSSIRFIINKTVKFEDCVSVYQELKERPEWLGVAIEYDWKVEKEISKVVEREVANKITNSNIRLGVIGLGNFFMSTLLPAIKKAKDLDIVALSNRNNMKLQYFSKKLNASIITTDYVELFKNKDIDLVMAITRHNLHFDLVKKAIEFKKNLFIEKPLCIKEEELNEIKNLINSSSELPLINIGFNRRFSSLIMKLKEVLNNPEKPMIVNYVVNSENFDKNMWVNTEEGGGQILGEGCAMIDLGLYLIGSEVVAINTNKIKDNLHLETGNIVSSISFKNGSVFNLIYTTLGNKKWPKESISVFYDGHNYIINDFKELKSSNRKYCLKLKKQDKGHMNEIGRLGKSLKEGIPLIPLNEIIKATEIAFEINKSNNK